MAEFPIELTSLVTLIDDDTYLDEWRGDLDGAVYLLEIDAPETAGTAAFFGQVREALGQQPESRDNWSAIEDDIRSSVSATDSETGAIVLRHCDRLLDGSLEVFLEAVDILRTTAKSAAGRDIPITQLFIILTGTGADFPTDG